MSFYGKRKIFLFSDRSIFLFCVAVPSSVKCSCAARHLWVQISRSLPTAVDLNPKLSPTPATLLLPIFCRFWGDKYRCFGEFIYTRKCAVTQQHLQELGLLGFWRLINLLDIFFYFLHIPYYILHYFFPLLRIYRSLQDDCHTIYCAFCMVMSFWQSFS